MSRSNFHRYAAAGAAIACAALQAACEGRQTGGTLPPAVTSGLSHRVAGARGVVTTFEDTFGDPTPAGITSGPDGALWFTDPGRCHRPDHDRRHLHASAGGRATVSRRHHRRAGQEPLVYDRGRERRRRTHHDGRRCDDLRRSGRLVHAGITVGPDHALWFAESNGTVGRMTTKGKVTHFTVAPSNAEL